MSDDRRSFAGLIRATVLAQQPDIHLNSIDSMKFQTAVSAYTDSTTGFELGFDHWGDNLSPWLKLWGAFSFLGRKSIFFQFSYVQT